MAIPKRGNNVITLGSGKLYLVEATGILPTKEFVFKEANQLGYIKGGAALEYTEETYEEKDDLGYVSKVITTNEEVILKCGLITWNGDTLSKLIDRCAVTTEGGYRTTKIGGAGNAKGKYYAVGFHHEDKIDGDLWVILKGRNVAGLSLAFATDAGTVIEPEFKAVSGDNKGTLVEIIEDISEGTQTTAE